MVKIGTHRNHDSLLFTKAEIKQLDTIMGFRCNRLSLHEPPDPEFDSLVQYSIDDFQCEVKQGKKTFIPQSIYLHFHKGKDIKTGIVQYAVSVCARGDIVHKKYGTDKYVEMFNQYDYDTDLDRLAKDARIRLEVMARIFGVKKT